jgi:hypothetical protein
MQFRFFKEFLFGGFYFLIFSLPFLILADFYCDDKLLIYLKESIKYFDLNPVKLMFDSFYGMLISGRLYLLYMFHYLIYFFNDNRLIFHVIKYFFNFFSLALGCVFLYLFTKNINNSKAFFFIVISLFLLIANVDPIVSMGVSVQFSVIFIFLAMIFTNLYFKNSQKKYFILSHIFCFLSYSYYEMGACIIPIMLILSNRLVIKENKYSNGLIGYLKATKKSVLTKCKSYLVIFLIWVICYIAVKISFKNGYDGVSIGYSLENFFLTWIIQIIATFPLGSFYDKITLNHFELWQIFGSIILFLFSYFSLTKFLSKINLKNYYRDLYLIGFSLLLIPSMIVSVSQKYQIWVMNLAQYYHYAFLQIFIQYFGMGLILLCFIAKTIENSKIYRSKIQQKILQQFYALAISLITVFVFLLNYNLLIYKNVNEANNQIFLLQRAINSNLFENKLINEKILNSKYEIAIHDIFDEYEFDKFSQTYKSKINNYKILFFNPFFISNGFFIKHLNENIIPLFIHNLPRDKINFNDKKLFFIDYGSPNHEVNFADEKLQLNLEGYIIFGSLASIEKKDSNMFLFNLNSLRIYLDKDYLFKLPQIIKNINKKFNKIIIEPNSLEDLKQRILKSKYGIVIDFENKDYVITH